MAHHRVSPLKKSDLQFKYAPGAAGNDNPALRGHPDSDQLNRGEWYEILYFINKFANDLCKSSSASAEKAERLIQRYVPKNIREQDEIRTWLIDNWDTHGDAPIK
jgi:hypothetical protein